MNLVYGNAHLTICAADGPGADAGLVGLQPKERRVTRHIEEYAPGVQLMVAHLGETYIEGSFWNERAWTFQERLLSRRCLIFAQGRIYFQCRSTTMSEDVLSEEKEAGWSLDLLNTPLQQMREVKTRPLRVYSTCVPMYTGRTLGHPEDIVAAFTGIGNTISKSLGGTLVYCLPDTHFDWALLWESRDAARRRFPHSKFPSWSWCGWEGSVMEYKTSTLKGCFANLHDWLTQHTWIVYYIRNEHGIMRLVWDCKRTGEEDVIERRWKGYKAFDASKDGLYDEFGRVPRNDYHELTHSNFSLTLPEYPYSVSIAEPTAEASPRYQDLRYLQFWTWSAYFRLETRGSSDSSTSLPKPGRNLYRLGISDRKGDWCGTIVLDYNWTGKQDPRTAHEFVAISEAKNFHKDEYDGWTYYIPKERDQSEWDLYFVLLIEKEGDVSHRVGLGKVFKQAFYNSFDPGRKRREFILG